MGILSDSDKQEIKKMFEGNLKEEVIINVVLDEKNKEPSNLALEIIKEVSEIDPRIKYQVFNDNKDEILEKYNLKLDKYGNRYGPIFFFDKKPNIIYYGLPAGYEFAIFLEDIMNISKNSVDISLKAAKDISKVSIPIDILVFVTPTCPYCPRATLAAHRFAFLNKNIRGIMVEATEFPEFSNEFKVFAVPKIVIIHKGKILDQWEGMIPEQAFSERILNSLENV